MAVITSIAVATAASAAAGAMKANADKKAAKNANDANYQQYLDSRGANGSAILPMYVDPGTEKQLFDDAMAAYQAGMTDRTPAEVLDHYRELVAAQEPAIQAGNAAIGDIYNGNMLRRSLAFQQPVNDARMGVADASADAQMQALRYERNRIAAEEARKGYRGAGSFVNNRLMDASLGARQSAAMLRATAAFDNARANADIQRGNQDLQIRSLDLAPNRAAQLIKLDQAPQEGMASLGEARLRPFQFFRLNPGNPPPVQPIPSTGAGQIALSSAGQIAGGVGNYYAQGRVADATRADTEAQRQHELDLARILKGGTA